MRQSLMTVTALAAFAAMVATAQAENQTPNPSTVSGPVKKRTVPQNQLASPTTEPSPADRGWDFAHPGRVERFSQPSGGTCTGLKSGCINGRMNFYNGRTVYFETTRERSGPYSEKYCNSLWERCMKSGFWEGKYIHRPAERH